MTNNAPDYEDNLAFMPTITWFELVEWAKEIDGVEIYDNYCIIANIKRINKMLEKVGGDLLNKNYWSSSEDSYNYAWGCDLGYSYGLDWYYKLNYNYVRPVLI